jgi:hypothetical protein
MLKNETPKLVRLKYGNPYCQESRDPLQPGMLVAWWKVFTRGGQQRSAVYCAACHRGTQRMLHESRKRWK